MTLRKGNDFREKTAPLDPADMLQTGVWYRSPLWSHAHMLGAKREWANDGIAWCGRSLGDAQAMPDTGERESLGGLWVEERTSSSALCSTCKRMQKDWDASF